MSALTNALVLVAIEADRDAQFAAAGEAVTDSVAQRVARALRCDWTLAEYEAAVPATDRIALEAEYARAFAAVSS